MFEKEFSPLYCPDNGRPVKPIRLMVGLFILKHVHDPWTRSWGNIGV